MSAVIVASSATGPLNSAEQAEIAAAHARAKVIRRAAGMAAFNGWVTAFLAAGSLPFAFFSVSSLVVTAGLAVVAYNELQGRKQLLEFRPDAASRLGWNQVGFLGLIIAYCLWMLYTGLTGEGPFAAEIRAKPELAMALDDIGQFDRLYRGIVVAVYVSVILLSIIFQGLNALYYFSRRKHVEAYVRQTPDWVVELQRLTPSV